jgi:putative ABC transport system permease protein
MPHFGTNRLRLLAHLALKNLVQNWRHSLATMLAILGGFAAVSLFDGFLQSIKEFNEEHFVNKGMVGHVIVEKVGAAEHLFEDVWRYSISHDEQEKLSKLIDTDPRVAESMPYLVMSGLISNGESSTIFIGAGYDEIRGEKIRGPKWAWNVIAGKTLSSSPPGGGLMLGMGLAVRMGCEYNPEGATAPDGTYPAVVRPLKCPGQGLQLSVTTEHAQVNALTVPVVGVTDFQLREFNDKVISAPLTTVQSLLDTDRITREIVLLKNSALIPSFIHDLSARAHDEGLDLEATKWIDHPVAAVSKGGLEVMGVFRGLFLAVVAMIAAMSVANSMMKSVNERIREIGTMRSFGFRRLDIILLFSFEGLFLGLASCVGGILVTVILGYLLSHSGISFKAGVLSTPIPVTF